MQHIELIIDNLHISYETKSTTKLGHPFSFGITLHHLELNVEHFKQIFLENRKVLLRRQLTKPQEDKQKRYHQLLTRFVQKNIFLSLL